MSNLREAAQQALEALENSLPTHKGVGWAKKHHAVKYALRAALAQPDDKAQRATCVKCGDVLMSDFTSLCYACTHPLAATQPPAELESKRPVNCGTGHCSCIECPFKQGPELSEAACDVIAERHRQVSSEGWTPEHDDEHVNDEIAAMAAFYAMPPGARDWPASETGYGDTLGEAIKPDGWDDKAGDRRRELVKAGALIIAEIERLDRAARGVKK